MTATLEPTALATVERDTSPEGLMALAIEKGISVEGMEKLMVLASQVREQRAKTAFIAALASFQTECPTIEKTRKVVGKDGKVRYSFAAMEDIKEVIAPILGEHGLSYTFDTSIEAGQMTVFCHIRHEEGHCESSSFAVPVGNSGFMSAPQEAAAALTYAKRYALVNSLGLVIGDEDNDAQKPQQQRPAQQQAPPKQEPQEESALWKEWISILNPEIVNEAKLNKEVLNAFKAIPGQHADRGRIWKKIVHFAAGFDLAFNHGSKQFVKREPGQEG